MAMKPKSSHKADPTGMDVCLTPAYGVEPLFPYLRPAWRVWEPCAALGHIVDVLRPRVADVVASDLRTSNIAPYVRGGVDFLATTQSFLANGYEADEYDCIITNPPFSLKYQFMERCYQLGKPFALLLPLETIGAESSQKFLRKYGLEILLLDKRIDFIMPNHGSTAQFPTAWLCWQMLPQPVCFAQLNKPKQSRKRKADPEQLELL